MKRILITAVIVTATALTALIAADTARERKLQQAIDLLETKGDVTRAVPLLEDVAKSSDKALAARGLLYLGQAQERQAGDRARTTYQRIVREFGSQKEIAAEAERRLGAAPRTLQARRLAISFPGFQFDNLQPDGQWLGGTDWNTGDLVMVHASTGEVRRLAPGTSDNSRFGEQPILSPDRRQIVFFWDDQLDKQFGSDSLRVVPNEPGGQPRALLREGQYTNFWPLAWSPDGKSILTSLDKRANGFDLAWVSASDGSIRVIKTLEPWRTNENMIEAALSPDSKYLAYSAAIAEGSPERAIYLLSADGKTESVFMRGGINEGPVWTPDGARIVFSSDRSGTFGLWSAPVYSGNRSGAASIVKAETGRIRVKGMTPSGTLFYDYQAGMNQVFVAEMEQAGGRARTSGKQVDSFVGVWPQWSRDGRWLAFKRSPAGTGAELVIHSMETNAQWTLRSIPMGQAGPPRWYKDDSVQPGLSTHRFSLTSGEPKEVDGPRAFPWGVLSLDDTLLYRTANRDPQNAAGTQREGIEVLDSATQQRKGFFPFPGGVGAQFTPALSPDGQTLAILRPQGVYRIQVDGTDYRELHATKLPAATLARTGMVKWTADGRSILFAQGDENQNVRIMRIPAEGGQPEFTGISAPVLTSFDLSPDGSRIAYAARSNNWELWALDNVASAWSGK